ncbi:MAG: DUF4446 family protein [Lachnospiraceae bacterium]|nr:DUF4446 family protein [Lachnospiraceae bacterium]
MNSILTSIGIDPGILMIILMIIDIVLIFFVLSLSMQVKRTNARYKSFMKGADGISLEKEIKARMRKMEKSSANVTAYKQAIEELQNTQKNTVHKYGMVKYDAFDDVGGKLSFVLAMLDDNNTGFVLNAVHSKENCFLYLKEIVKGESYIMLSDEEIQALRIAEHYGMDDETIE